MRPRPSLFLTFGCLVIGCTVALARIGETEEQCDERYGKPFAVSEDKVERTYKKGEFHMRAQFHDGKCDLIMFAKPDGTPQEISESERDVLMKANGGGREWQKSKDGAEVMHFETRDGELYALYNSRGLMIATREATKRKDAAKKAEMEKKLKGF